ncbi:hypothetical protein HBH96_013500 [Parastagonospora nodorum]|nr:hypothetical protein HBH96_013500 [Parastagonospora nodorum]
MWGAASVPRIRWPQADQPLLSRNTESTVFAREEPCAPAFLRGVQRLPAYTGQSCDSLSFLKAKPLLLIGLDGSSLTGCSTLDTLAGAVQDFAPTCPAQHFSDIELTATERPCYFLLSLAPLAAVLPLRHRRASPSGISARTPESTSPLLSPDIPPHVLRAGPYLLR